MYNEEIKRRFIESYTKSDANRAQCERAFEKTQELEEKYGIDLCEFDVKQMQEAFDLISGRQTNSQLGRFTILKAYSKWCINQGIPNAKESISEISSVSLEKVKRQMVSSPTHLQFFLDSVYEKEDRNTTDNVSRCFYWLAFSGVKIEDAIELTASNIDFTNMLIKVRDEEYPIYREAVPSLRNCINLTAFEYNHPRYSTTLKQVRSSSDQLLRLIGTDATLQGIRDKTSRTTRKAIKEGKTNIELSYSRVRLSGFFYRIYELERIGIKPRFTQLAVALMEGKEYSLEKSRHTVEGTIRIINNRYKKDYERWKQAFYS